MKMWTVAGLSAAMIVMAIADGVVARCPNPAEIHPCKCIMKAKGVDVVCNNTDKDTIKRAMEALQKKQTSAISYLKLRENNLPRLPNYFFFGLTVKHITIHNSNLATVDDSALSAVATSLSHLDLSTNKLVNVPSNAFKELHNLVLLNLNHNHISVLHARAFDGLGKLERLHLLGNFISRIDPDTFRGIERKLDGLSLGGNRLNAVPAEALSLLTNLVKLELQSNNITNISENDFQAMKKLDTLNLMNNQIHHLPGNVFANVMNLNSLDLDNNSMVSIDPEAFHGLGDKLEWLKLGYNKLQAVPGTALRGLRHLKSLDLRDNLISSLDENTFQGFGPSLKYLYLQNNRVKELPNDVFAPLNSLENLKMNMNELEHIPHGSIDEIVDTLINLDFHDNPLKCDCGLKWYKVWLQERDTNEDNRIIEQHTVCTQKENHRRYNIKDMPIDEMNCPQASFEVVGSSATTIALSWSATIVPLVLSSAVWKMFA